MCDFSGKLVAWMDRELPDDEAGDVGRHVGACAECRSRVDAYGDVSRTFVGYCDAVLESKTRYRLPRWVPLLSSAAAAAVLFLVFLPASVKQIPVRPRVAGTSQAIVLETAPRPVRRVHRRHVGAPIKTPNVNWGLAEPAIQIAIPADAMFPPGAVPEGINFIADLSIAADGSVQTLLLQE